MINLDFYKTGDGTKQFWGDEKPRLWSHALNREATIVALRPQLGSHDRKIKEGDYSPPNTDKFTFSV